MFLIKCLLIVILRQVLPFCPVGGALFFKFFMLLFAVSHFGTYLRWLFVKQPHLKKQGRRTRLLEKKYALQHPSAPSRTATKKLRGRFFFQNP